MKISIDNLTKKWDSLSSATEGYVLVAKNDPVEFHVGFNGKGKRSFAVINSPKLEKLSSSKAVGVRCVQMAQVRKKYALEFTLYESELNELFVNLCWDLISVSSTSKNPVKSILTRYAKWMKLLEKASTEIMSYSRQKGLMGELMYLKWVINKEDENSVLSWVGPDGSDQDFIFDYGWTEVKAVAIAATDVSISSLQQLEREDEGRLVIYFMDKIDAKGKNAYSLPDMVESVKTSIADQQLLDDFMCKLSKYGYLKKDEEHYKNIFYRLTEHRTYKVDNSFPKLVKNNVPVEVTSTNYKIDIAAIEKYRV